MGRKTTWLVALGAVALGATPLVGFAGAQPPPPSLGVHITDMAVNFEDERAADLWINATLDRAAADQLRFLSDTNFSGTVSDVEAERMLRVLRETLLGGEDFQRAQRSLLLDNRTPSHVGEVQLTIDGLMGPTRRDAPATVALATNLTWTGATPNATGNATVGNETHEFRIPGDVVIDPAQVRVVAPPGYEVRATEGLDAVTTSLHDTAAAGYAQPERAVAVLFAPPPPPPPEDEVDAQDDDGQDVPMGGALVVLAAAAGAAVALRRAQAGRRR